MRALLLHLGDEVYALDMAVAREVVAAPGITSLPSAPANVLGVFNLRGEIVPVFDTARLLGLAAEPATTHVVVVDTADGPAGLTTGMGQSVELDEPVGPTETPGTVAAYDIGQRLAVLIDIDALLAPVRVGG